MATIFYALTQGEVGGEDSADLVGVFSTYDKAADFGQVLSDAHTDAKRFANELRERKLAGDFSIEVPEIPDLYWDINRVLFDPRGMEDLS